MRITKLFFFLMAVIAMTGCEKQTKYKIAVSQCSDDDWRQKLNDEILREIVFHPDAEVEIRSANDSNEQQIEDIRYFMQNNFDIILIAPNEADAITPIVDEVYQAGIPIIIFDRNINSDSYTALQGVDDQGIGAAAADYAREIVGENAKIIEIQGLPGSTPAIDRHKGFASKAEKYGFETLASVNSDWNYEKALAAMDSLLAQHRDVDLVFAHNDRMALAAADVAKARGLRPKILGIDAVPEVGIKAVVDGVIDGTFIYPTEGNRLINTAMSILEGKPYEKETMLSASSPVTASNADILLVQNEALLENSIKVKELKEELSDYWSQHSSQTILVYVIISFVILLFAFLFMLLRAFWQKQKYHAEILEQNKLLEQQRDNEKALNEQLNQATQSKLMFFTNVSHDLRTPLALISEPVDQLTAAENLDEGQRKLMNIASRNVKILRRLINEILDFRKYENGKLALNLSEVKAKPVISDWTESFHELDRRHAMRLEVSIDIPDDFAMAMDVEKIERVFFNLMSNAFKYTPANGLICLRCGIDTKANNLFISVKDNGKGIAKQDIGNIFDRFYQVDKVHPKGSGIGLSLAKAFVEMHQGTITVESELGKGTEFIVTLPVCHVSQEAQEEFERVVTTEDIEAELDHPETENSLWEQDENKPLLLVIDDNLDMRQLVGELMCDEYNVVFASNGSQGVKMAVKYVPDLIICDVMMPGMDGLECCRFIKNETSTSHIPVLMLTACSLDEQRVSGYASGAEGYVSKPFSAAVLKAKCKSLLENRRRLSGVLSMDSQQGERKRKNNPLPGSTDPESEFYSRFITLVRDNMANMELNVDMLASKLGMGRSQLYRKIKALTNYSPVELLRDIRLKKSRELLTSTEKSISEIAYEVGFSTPAYFTKCYRDVYGETPSEFREKLGHP